jgi:hypothetical protein
MDVLPQGFGKAGKHNAHLARDILDILLYF